MKDLPYITHDFGARNDPKLMDLQMDMGGQGLAIFWCLVEMLWENGGVIPANYKSIAFSLRWCKPAEVEKVVTGYGLFEVTEGCLHSHSATARIDEMRKRFGIRSEASRKANQSRWGSRRNENGNETESEYNPNGVRTESERSANGIPLTNILTNKHTNILTNSNNTPLTAAEIFEIFTLGKNFKDPAGEVTRFLKHYEDNGWTYTDGTPVANPIDAAWKWIPAKEGKRFDTEALNWYRAVWNAARDRVPNAADIFINGLAAIRRKDNAIAISYFKEADARVVAAFIMQNDLAGDYTIDYRLEN